MRTFYFTNNIDKYKLCKTKEIKQIHRLDRNRPEINKKNLQLFHICFLMSQNAEQS
jgi:hypothetical protein